MTDRDQLYYLFDRYMQKTCTPEEKAQFFSLLADPSLEEQFSQINESYPALPANGAALNPQTTDAVWEAIRKGVPFHKASPVRRMRIWWAAAAVLLLLVAGYWLLDSRFGAEKPAVVQQPVKENILPGSSGAILTLADGRQMVLDSTGNGSIAQEGDAAVTKQGSELIYNATDSRLPTNDSRLAPDSRLAFNTVTTPRGKQFQLRLQDGTKVWLNAASSIRYPAVFTGAERRVEVTGEAYFEVARNESKPFIVDVNGKSQIEVLGTHFNINAYNDEPAIITTLLEGKVKVSATQPETLNPKPEILQPGQESIQHNDKITVNEADTESAVAWIHGTFNFKSADLQMVLRQVARWYDVEFKYDGKINERFSGSMYRSEDFYELLKIIEFTSNVKFTVNQKTITVSRK